MDDDLSDMAAGWAVAGDTPFMWTKQIPSNYGGTRNGMIVSWPKRIKATNQVRSQWHHVIDVAPSVLEAASLPEPKSVNGTVQSPIEGVSMLYSFDKPDAKSTPRPIISRFRQSRITTTVVCRSIHASLEMTHGRGCDDKWELYDTVRTSAWQRLAAANRRSSRSCRKIFMRGVKYACCHK